MPQISAGAGSSGDIFNHAQPNSPKHSAFDLSEIINLTADSGMIVPFTFYETLPGDEFDLSAEVNLQSLPCVSNVLTPYKVKLHYYYCKLSDLWAGANTLITKGRSGNINLKVPQVKIVSQQGFIDDGPHSLASFLGRPPAYDYAANVPQYLPYLEAQQSIGDPVYSTADMAVSALPFMMYQSICKYNYVNQNLLQDNLALFPPEGDFDWRLPYLIDNASTTNLCNTVSGKWVTDLSHFSYDGIYRATDDEVSLTKLRYAPFDDDYFTSALPWLQRGSVKTMPFDISSINGTINMDNPYLVLRDERFTSESGVPDAICGSTASINPYNASLDPTGKIVGVLGEGHEASHNRPYVADINGKFVSLNGLNLSGSITANMLRELIAMSVWQERNARVNGSYNSMIWVHWSQNPDIDEHRPVFIGGTSSYINFSEIMQTSQSSSDSPLGSSAGRGSLYDSSGIGKFRCKDYGYIMGIMIISPTTTYNSSTPHALICDNIMEDFPQPEFESLSPQPILNKELFYSGSESVDNDLFGYQERYSYLKSRQNVNRGLFRLRANNDILFSSSTQSRDFETTPSLSYQFVTQSPANTRRDWLAYPNYPMFKIQIANKVRCVRSLSYASVPNTFGF